jgi:tetratricopeptide (TPR) repeat protein
VASGVNSLEDSTPQTLAALRLRYEWDLKSAEREVKRAVELKSNYPAAHQWNAVYLLCRKLSLDALDLSRTEENPAATQRGASMLEPSLADQFNSTSLTPAEELQVVCLVAREQIAAGNPEAACLVLQRWYCLGQWPSLEGLSSQCSADLLFTAGKLAGHVGIRRQVPRAQKHAEALLNGAIGIFEQLGLKRQSAEGQMELGVCYWREGLFDLARTTFLAADNELKVHDDELRGRALLLLAMNEFSAGRLHDALARLKEVSTIIETTGPWLTAIYNHQLALIFRNLSIAENASDYFERALNHYIDALDQFEAVGNYESAAYTENNCGYLLLTHNYLTAAETHLMRARKLFEITNRIVPGQFEDTRARFYVAAEQFDLAEQAIARSITTLEKSGEEAGLAESLITKGILLCRAGRYRKAKRVLEHARQIAERCDDRKGVVHALLTLIEELWLQLEDDERVELRATLDQMLAEAQETSTIERFRKCLGLIA